MTPGLTLKRDAIKDLDLIVEILSCVNCEGQSFTIYYPMGDLCAHLYCNNEDCRMVYVNHKGLK